MCRRFVLFLVTIRSFFRVFSRLVVWQSLLIVIASVTWGQDASTGALRGVVLDAHGAAITDADIVAIRVETGIRYHSATDSAGRFAVDLLPPGQYSARAESEGMSPQISPAIRVEVGATTELTFKLKVAGPKEMITVAEAPRVMDADPSSVSALVDERAIKDLPLNGRRFTDLLLLAPGVTQDPRGLTSGSNGDLSYGGLRGYNTSFLVDGGDNNNGFFAQASGRYRAPFQFSNEVVQEFRVQSSGYGAESGRAGGAVVNVVTKSARTSGTGARSITCETVHSVAPHLRLLGSILLISSTSLERPSAGPFIRDLADVVEHQLSVPAMHQHGGSTDFATGGHRPV